MTENIYSTWPYLVPYIHLASMFFDIIRQIGWAILIGLGMLVSAVYEAYLNLFNIDLSSVPVVGEWLKGAGTLWPAILTIFLILAGIYIMFGNKKVQKELASGLLLAIILLIITPFLFSTMGDFVATAIPAINEQFTATDGNKSVDISDKIIRNYTVDILRSAEDGSKLVYLDTNPDNLSINTKIGGYFGEKDLFNYKVTEISDAGVASGTTLKSDAWFMEDTINDGLYRYDYKFLEPLLILILMLLGIVFAALRTAKIMFELVFNQTIAPFVFATDPYNAGRTKEFIKKIISTYIVLVVIFFLLLLFMSLSLWVLNGDNVPNVWTQIFLIAGCAWGMIDGPDIVVKLLGIDAGVRSASAPLIATGMALGAAGRAAGGAARLGKGVAGNTASVLGSSIKDNIQMTQKSFGESGWGLKKREDTPPPAQPSSSGSGAGSSPSPTPPTSAPGSSSPISGDTGFSQQPFGSTQTDSSSLQVSDPAPTPPAEPSQPISLREASPLPQDPVPSSDARRPNNANHRPLMRSPFTPTLPPTYQPPTVTPLAANTTPVEEEPIRSGYMAPPDLSQTDRLLQQRKPPVSTGDPPSIPPPTITSRQGPGTASDSDWKKYQDRRDK